MYATFIPPRFHYEIPVVCGARINLFFFFFFSNVDTRYDCITLSNLHCCVLFVMFYIPSQWCNMHILLVHLSRRHWPRI